VHGAKGIEVTPMSVVRSGKFRRVPLRAAILVAVAMPLPAATIAVDDAETGSVPGKCTLFDAVAALNTAAPVNGCVAGDGNADTIDLSFFTAPTTISFSLPGSDGNSALVLSKPATIRGAWLGKSPLVTLQRSSVSGIPMRLIHTTADLTLVGLQLSGGQSLGRGGALYVGGSGNLSLSHVVISGNATAADPVFSGGGIDVEHGTIDVDRSTIQGNSASLLGGGIYTPYAGAITLTNSTISDNIATGNGGGVASFNGAVTATASTFSGNRAYLGGGIYARGAVTLTNSTLTGNYALQYGAAFYAYPVGPGASVYFSTIADNTTQAGDSRSAARFLAVASIFSNNNAKYNHRVCASGSNYNVFYPASSTGRCTPGTYVTCQPNLSALADNGGPTPTRALVAGCGVDSGPTDPPPGIQTDQRGRPYARKFGTRTDIGAFEAQMDDVIFYDGFDTS
jgi:predicted outer membrane repeat protein